MFFLFFSEISGWLRLNDTVLTAGDGVGRLVGMSFRIWLFEALKYYKYVSNVGNSFKFHIFFVILRLKHTPQVRERNAKALRADGVEAKK